MTNSTVRGQYYQNNVMKGNDTRGATPDINNTPVGELLNYRNANLMHSLSYSDDFTGTYLFFFQSNNRYVMWDHERGSYLPQHHSLYTLCQDAINDFQDIGRYFSVYQKYYPPNEITYEQFVTCHDFCYFIGNTGIIYITDGVHYISLTPTNTVKLEFYYSKVDFIMSSVDDLVSYIIHKDCHGIVAQSGTEQEHDEIDLDVKYSQTKKMHKVEYKKKLIEKMEKTNEDLKYKNLGSKKKRTKKNFLKKLKTQHCKIGEQSGKEIRKDIGQFVSYIEKICGLYLLKYYDKPLYLGLSALLLLFKGSITESGFHTVQSLFGSIKNSDSTLADLVNWLKSMLNDFTAFRNNKYAKSFICFISKSLTTIMSPSIINFFSRESDNKMVQKIFSFIDEDTNPIEFVLNCLTYLTSGVETFVRTGTLDGFINTETTADSILEKMRDCRQKFILYNTGDLEFIKCYHHYVFQKDINDLKTEIQGYRKSRRGIELKQMDDWLKELDAMSTDIERAEKHKTARVQPYHIILVSGSGISKTYLSKLLVSSIAIANDIPYGPEYTYYLNQMNEFQSQWKNYFTVIIGDDTNCLLADKMNTGLNLANWRIRSSNNETHELIGASIAEKGTLFNRGLIELWNSNSFDQSFHESVRNVAAVHRRTQVRIVGKVRPEFQKDNTGERKSSMIDYSKIPEEERNSIAPDAWLFDAYVCEVADTDIKIKRTYGVGEKERDSEYRFVITKDEDGKDTENMDLLTLMNFLTWNSKSHFATQKKVLEMDEKVYNREYYCTHGIPKQYDCKQCGWKYNKPEKVEYKIVPMAKHIPAIDVGRSLWYLENGHKTSYKNDSPCQAKCNTSAHREITDPVIDRLYLQQVQKLKINNEIIYGDHYIEGENFHHEKSNLVPIMKRYVFKDLREGRSNYFKSYYLRIIKHKQKVKMSDYEKGLLCFDFGILLQNGTEKQRVTYMANLLEAIREKKVFDIFSRITDISNFSQECKKIVSELVITLQSWFDEFVCDVIEYFLNKLVDTISKFIKNPTAFIPSYLEDTIVGAYCYSKHPLLKIPIAIDYARYVVWHTSLKMIEPQLARTIEPEFEITNFVYKSFIKTKTREEKEKEKLEKCLTLADFASKACLSISKKEGETKRDDPNFLRDFIVPSIGAGLIVSKFIPSFCRSFSKLYLSDQVGYEVSVEEIKQLDTISKDQWYLRKREIMCTVPDTVIKAPYGELENLIVRNSFYFRNVDSTTNCTALSPCNQFLIFPYHFVKESMGHVIQGLKTEILDMKKPGNAIVEFTLSESMVYKLQGDACLVYTEKIMDHMRTKDLTSYFPNALSPDVMCGRVYSKGYLSKLSTLDATDIRSSDFCNNECLNLGQSPQNPFKGYFYLCNNFQGLCGGAVLDHYHKASHILGIHVGGNPETKVSVACTIFRNELTDGVSHFKPNGMIKQNGFHVEKFGKDVHVPDIYKKNPFLDTVDKIDGVELLGSIPNRITPDAKVVQTPISEEVRQLFETDVTWSAPPFKHNGDKRHGVRNLIKVFASKKTLKHPHILERAVDDYSKSIMIPYHKNEEFWKEEIRLLNEFECVNGIIGKRYCSGMKMSTKASTHLKGTKSEYAELDNGAWFPHDIIINEYHRVLGLMKQREWTPEMSMQMLKNEATIDRKVQKGKVRSFYSSCFINQMIVRKYLLTTIRYFCLNTPYTETTVGINPHGKDWDYFVRELIEFRRRVLCLIALDLRNFDLTSLFEVVARAIDILFLPLLATNKLNEEDLNVVACIKHSLLYSIVDVSGDLVCLHGIIPSGSPITSILGSAVNSINFRMAYFFHYENTTRMFRDVVCLRTYGDDSVANADKAYNKMTVKDILSAWDVLGIQGTNIQKEESTTIKYYKLEDIEFLKRGLVYDKVFKSYVGPLAQESMLKSLCAHIPPRTMSLEAVTGQCVDNFAYEAKFHGKKFFNKYYPAVLEIAKKHDLGRFILTQNMTYEDHLDVWRKQNDDVEQITESRKRDQIYAFRHFMSENFDLNTWFGRTPNTTKIKNEDQNHAVVKMVDVPDRTQIKTQSGVESTEEEVMNFLEIDDSNILSIGGSMPVPRVTDKNATLGEFLARPVKIAEWNWGNVQFHQILDPWVELWENKRISNRLSNYTLFRGKCKVKFVINGNGFFYGKLMATYLPFSKIDTFVQKAINPLHRIPASQLPKVFLDPTLSEGAEITLPFFYPSDYVNLTDDNNKRSLGEIIVHQIAGLKHANQDIVATGTVVTITAFAWFEDVELQGPTHTNATGITAQSGREEETVNKPISQACTAVASVSRSLSRVPIISPYALAIEQGASIASTIASALGYCRPSNVVEPDRVQPRVTDNMSVCNTTDNSQKLTVDVKQDLSIDSRLCGLDGIDEMSISRITGVDSFVTSFLWGEVTAPESLIFSIYVTPMLFYNQPVVNNIYMTAICGASNAFDYWTGSIEYNFQIVSSSYHRGRLAIVYDPIPYDSLTVSREDNVAYTHIVDISETRDFSLTIGNYQKTQWLSIEDGWENTPPYSTSGSLNTQKSWTNGTINVYVLNELTTPASDPTLNNDITIAVYAKAGPDFRLAAPGDRPSYAGIYAQSGTENPDEIGTNSTISEQRINPIMDKELRTYMGEEISSFRTLLKRYNGYTYINLPGPFKFARIVHQAYPHFKGYATNVPYIGVNRVNCTLMSYLMRCFAGWRGSARWKIIYNGQSYDTLQVSRRHATDVGVYNASVVSAGTPTVDTEYWLTGPGRYTQTGSLLTAPEVNSIVDFEVPFYSNYKFIAGKPKDFTTAVEPYCLEGFSAVIARENQHVSDSNATLFVSAGEDFNLMFFTGFQPMTFSSP